MSWYHYCQITRINEQLWQCYLLFFCIYLLFSLFSWRHYWRFGLFVQKFWQPCLIFCWNRCSVCLKFLANSDGVRNFLFMYRYSRYRSIMWNQVITGWSGALWRSGPLVCYATLSLFFVFILNLSALKYLNRFEIAFLISMNDAYERFNTYVQGEFQILRKIRCQLGLKEH